MTKSTIDSLKAEPDQKSMEQELSDHFMDYLSKSRETLKLKYKDNHNIDSEIAIFTYHIMHEFDKYRTRSE